MENYRTQPRYSLLHAPIEDACIALHGSVYPAEIINISRGGTFVRLQRSLPCGAEIELSFSLPEVDQKCRIPCIVRWTGHDGGAGLQFRHLHAVELWGLNRLIQALSTVSV